MKVQSASILQYETSTGPWKLRWVRHPSFEQIEESLRSLDGDLLPSIELYFDAAPFEDDIPDFEVLGGNVGYFIEARVYGSVFHYDNPAAPPNRLPVWISDQGAEFPARQVCPEIELVIAAARFFYDFGELMPDFPWKGN